MRIRSQANSVQDLTVQYRDLVARFDGATQVASGRLPGNLCITEFVQEMLEIEH